MLSTGLVFSIHKANIFGTTLQVVPWGFRRLLDWIANEYNNPPVFVTESGIADFGGLRDANRINYLTVSIHVYI